MKKLKAGKCLGCQKLTTRAVRGVIAKKLCLDFAPGTYICSRECEIKAAQAMREYFTSEITK